MLLNPITMKARLKPDVGIPTDCIRASAGLLGLENEMDRFLGGVIASGEGQCSLCAADVDSRHGLSTHVYHDFDIKIPRSPNRVVTRDELAKVNSRFLKPSDGVVPDDMFMVAQWVGTHFVCQKCKDVIEIGQALQSFSKIGAESPGATKIVKAHDAHMRKHCGFANPLVTINAIAEAWRGYRHMWRLAGGNPDKSWGAPSRSFLLDLKFGYEHPSLRFPEQFLVCKLYNATPEYMPLEHGEHDVSNE